MPVTSPYKIENLPDRLTAVKLANTYLQERIYRGSNPQIIFEHGTHIFNVARIAERIAINSKKLNPDIAYILGLLHDAGRVKDETVTNVPHTLEGYRYLCQKGYPAAAQICITHSFIDRDVQRSDYPRYTNQAFAEVCDFLKNVRYNDYDRLIQLADLFSRGKEILSIRQRLDKNKRFYGIENLSYEDKAFSLRDYFNQKYNIDVEQIIADTFQMYKCTNPADDRDVTLHKPLAETFYQQAVKCQDLKQRM